ncbi:hypothetical protein DFH06DRAFT_1472691 [Mycena polygramma]|nr:hypothetical protein DFH06DRAFT_1472691 [Mycena polygramma]
MLTELAADRARIADIELEILDHERSISTLRNAKAQVQERLHSYKYPVLTLPNELVTEIFTHFLPVYPLCPPSTGRLSPTSLTHVCRAWRDIALANPALWRAVSLAETRVLSDPVGHTCNILGKAGSYPLPIRMHKHPDQHKSHPAASEVLEAALAYRARWECLQLRFAHSYDIDIGGSMPLLRHVDLELDDHMASIKLTDSDAPLLHTAILDLAAAAYATLPWTQLTSLTLRILYFSNCLRVLQQTTNLVHCELDIHPDENLPAVYPDLTFPRLESLALNNLNAGPMTGCLDSFIAPGLRRLQLQEIFLRPNPLDSLASFISKSGCKLKELCITGKRTVMKDAYTVAFPSIKVSFSGRYEDDGYWEDDSSSDGSGSEYE